MEAHQPRRLRSSPPSTLTSADDLIEDELDSLIFRRVSERCYRPLLETLEATKGLKAALKVTGTLLEQIMAWEPELLEDIKSLTREGKVELVTGPYYNSLAGLIDPMEFVEETKLHIELLDKLMGVKPGVFANPFLIYDDEVGRLVGQELGLKVVMAEASPRVLGWRAPSYVYVAASSPTELLLRDYRLSDVVAFGLARGLWASDYAARISKVEGQVVLVGFPAETFGELIPASAGVFEFLKSLPRELSKYPWVRISTPSEAVEEYEPVDELCVEEAVSWLESKDISPLTRSPLQAAAFEMLRELKEKALSSQLARGWRLLAQGDLIYSMGSSLEAFITFERAICALRTALEMDGGRLSA